MSFSTLDRALPLDLALTLNQACHMTGHSPAAILDHVQRAGHHLAQRHLGLTRNCVPEPVTFICRDARTSAYDGDLLRQLAGTAALRHLRAVRSTHWRVCAHHGAVLLAPGRWLSHPTPDAEWLRWGPGSDLVTWYVEYDAGSHTRTVLAERLLTYAQPARRGGGARPQLWGAATRARTRTLIELAAEVLPLDALVIVRTVNWRPTLPLRAEVDPWLRSPLPGRMP